MLYVFCLFTPLYRCFRLSRVWHAQECEEIYRLVSENLNFTPCGSVFDRFCVPSKMLDFAVLERGGGYCRQGTSQQPTPRSRFTDFPGARGGLLTCRLAPNVRQAIACGVELGGMFLVLDRRCSSQIVYTAFLSEKKLCTVFSLSSP